eukprot:6185505-Pleurochrysis_carterae.AAC.1
MASATPPVTLASRAELIPLRLNETERSLLRPDLNRYGAALNSSVAGALSVSEYTDKVDVISFRYNRGSRVQEQLEELLATISGLTIASSYKGAALVRGSAQTRAAAFDALKPHRSFSARQRFAACPCATDFPRTCLH